MYLSYRSLLMYGLFFSSIVFANECPLEMENEWCWPTGTSQIGSYLQWHGVNDNFVGKVHLASDIKASPGTKVYAIADGKVMISRTDIAFYGGTTRSDEGGGIIIRHMDQNGKEIDVLYAHIDNPVEDGWNQSGDELGTVKVVKGQVIGYVNTYTNGSDHLHFAVAHKRENSMYEKQDGTDPMWAGYGSSDSGFINPFAYLNSNYPDNYISDSSTITDIFVTCWGHICWEAGSSHSCESGDAWYFSVNGQFVTATSDICYGIKVEIT